MKKRLKKKIQKRKEIESKIVLSQETDLTEYEKKLKRKQERFNKRFKKETERKRNKLKLESLKEQRSNLINIQDVKNDSKKIEELRKEANRKLKDLRKNKEDTYSQQLALNYIKKTHGNKFYTFQKNPSYRELQEIVAFLNSKTSTLEGKTRIFEQTHLSFELKFQRKIDKNKLKIFLESKQFQTAMQYAPSEEIFETFFNAIDDGQSVETVLNEFDKFNDTDITWDEIEENLGTVRYV